MEPWLLLILLILFTYLLSKQSVANINRGQTMNQPSESGETGTPPRSESSLRPITKQEETDLRNCFPWGVYYLQHLEYRPQAVLCRGQLRTNPDRAYQTVRNNIEAEFGDRFFVIFQESFSGKPFFALVPNPYTKKEGKSQLESLTQPGLALVLLIVTLITTTLMGATEIAGISTEKLQSNPTLILQGLPYALALMTILSTHELGHYLVAIYYKMRTTLPYFIPVPYFLGTFGAFISMRSPVPNRKALFDVAIAGPIAGLIVTIPVLLWGLAHSGVVPLSDGSGILNLESLDPRFSFLLSLLSKLGLGGQLTPEMAIKLHPVAVAGYVGLIVTAFNLIPVGQLDGGHIVHAMFGQKTGAAIGQITRILILLLGIVEKDLLLWAIILLFMPVADEPALNDVSELNNWRDFAGLMALALLVAIVLPLPGTIAGVLQI
ncbi:MAG TPA: site-2 protease family protein [Cyanobacteria bacterium UBA11149]|nr:site-2 protease family protein [Cyanobacteria bacterium UBA11367]HBE60971.1 site-2 protease family protein [Cyanobacteria bacterium UBA11366]HBR77149.1 site-2 protease family protein [Cyanobacteria bacterium UBA11159]HBS71387.1 site-2 protease family protein [Cyanobacteria bacterium UBA11153]HBW91596.1 site-2 protease family protein [Cyanobacteria bacterium UBA11149]HCA95531.1 site-2 protease family protein [Cyanobacteria bacterium UBA9226]